MPAPEVNQPYLDQMTQPERRHGEDVLSRLAADGALYRVDRFGEHLRDGAHQLIPADYEVVRGRRWCVDKHGVVWRFAAEGSAKLPGDPHGGGAPRRNDAVEMWGGHWRRDAAGRFVKSLLWAPVGAGVNEHPGVATIDWYQQAKGFRHPNDGPNVPTDYDLRLLRRRSDDADAAISAQMSRLSAEGVEAAELLAGLAPAAEAKTQAQSPSRRRGRGGRKSAKRSNRDAIEAGPPHGGADLPAAPAGAA